MCDLARRKDRVLTVDREALRESESKRENEERHAQLTMESVEDAPTTTTYDLQRKESPLNPYNRTICSKVYPKCPSGTPPQGEEEESIINVIPEFECGIFPKSHLDSCSCCPRIDGSTENSAALEGTPSIASKGNTKQDGCCRMQWKRRDTYYKIKAKVENAVKKHKVFLIRGELPKLKEALEERGWVQKYESNRTRTYPYGSLASLESRSLGDITLPDGTINERALIFAMLRHKAPDFIWDCRNDFVEWHRGLKNNVLVNRYQRPFVYTSKLGMATLLENAHWLHENGVSSVNLPRCYNLHKDPKTFIDDFRLTAAAGLLKWFVRKVQRGQNVFTDNRAICMGNLEFAVRRCEEFAADLKHRNIDGETESVVPEEEWNFFLDEYSTVIHNDGGIRREGETDDDRIQSYYMAAMTTLRKLKELDPQYELNGIKNVWILKPSNLCCGCGIVISHSLKEIFRKIDDKSKDYFVIQKYIEHPLLIRQTKFDIRLWYLVTSSFPLTIWLYREALLRFSSRPYSLSSYHPAIHICNTAVQEKYEYERRRRRRSGSIMGETEKSVRDMGWDCEKLNDYLKQVGYPGEPYCDKIYPKMAEAIVCTMLAAQEHMDRRRCSFELYGADFVVMEDLSVWLIEINTNPRMHPPSSRITKRLYGDVLESLVKVIMDLPLNPRADTGGFRLAYKQNTAGFQPYLGPCLFVFGKSIVLHEQPQKEKEKREIVCGPWSKQQRAWTAPPTIQRLRDPDVVDFIDYLNANNNDCSNGSNNCSPVS